MSAHERFLKYISFPTESFEASPTTPSTKEQFALANELVSEMKELGLSDVRVDEKCYVYGVLPATPGYEQKPAIGFIAHMDTVEDFGQRQTKPQILPNYDGKAVKLGTSGKVLDPAQFPHLEKLKGKTLITTDGTTTLGSDDKAGIAEIMDAVETLIRENIPHGKICVGFTPDEEIGRGADFFDVPAFGADFGYTVDSGEIGLLEYENFNAAKAVVKFHGVAVHPGAAKNIMVNPILMATEFVNALPKFDTPAHTEGYEGFFHLRHFNASELEGEIQLIIRDHDFAKFEMRQEFLNHIVKSMKEKYGDDKIELEITEQYRNMEEMVRPHMHIIDNAKEAMRENGVEPIVVPIRGGTDGARLSYMGLPCPNMCTGGFCCHGPFEHVTFEDMDRISQIVVSIIRRYANA